MSRAYDNWQRLIRATLSREHLRASGQGHEKASNGIAGAVPASLTRTTNIDAILQAADEIQGEDPNVARICNLSDHIFNVYSISTSNFGIDEIFLHYVAFLCSIPMQMLANVALSLYPSLANLFPLTAMP